MIPCVLHEDEHLLVVDKPAGVNTHAPSPFAAEGLYDWLRHREPRWATLAILHRLDKETSGVMVFGKTPLANRSLTEQFTQRQVRKKYLLLTDRPVPQRDFTVKSALVRVGEKYAGRADGEPAETHFRVAATEADSKQGDGEAPLPSLRATLSPSDGERAGRGVGRTLTLVEAEPHTGRTHQIRVHAAESGFPILGDTLYGGSAAARVYLHAAELRFKHPATGAECVFKSPVEFATRSPSPQPSPAGRGGAALPRTGNTGRIQSDPALETILPLPQGEGRGEGEVGKMLSANLARRIALIDPAETNAFRLVHGASDGWPGWYVERLGDFLLSQSERPLEPGQLAVLREWLRLTGARGAYHKMLNRQIRRAAPTDTSPQLALGEPAPAPFEIYENGVRFELSFAEGYSVGLFLDQRDNRRRFLTGHIAAGFPLTPSLSPSDGERVAAGRVRGRPVFELLNCFAYTCGFSVCAALGGARVTSLDLSKKYLDWGRRNFALNGLDPAQHDFIFGDTFDWLRRLAKKGRAFDVIVLDPPTFSQSKTGGVFRAEKDYGRLVAAALPVLKPDGVLLASTNAADWPPEAFVETIHAAVASAKRRVAQEHFVPQPLDFPITRAEPGYLKTLWARVTG